MPLPWTKDQADTLLRQGAITSDQYNAAFPSDIGVEPVGLSPLGPDVAPEVPQIAPEALETPDPASLPAEEDPGLIAQGFNALTDTIKGGVNKIFPKSPAEYAGFDPSLGGPSGMQAEPSALQPTEVNLPQNEEVLPATDMVKTPLQLEEEKAKILKAQNEALAKETAGLLAPYETMMNAAKFSEMTGMARAAEESAYLKRLQREQDQKLNEQIEWEESQRLELESKLNDLDRKADELSNRKIVEKDFWGDKSTGQKILGGVALFLGAVGAAKTGVNTAVKVIEDAINRDIDVQRLNLSQANAAFNAKSNLYTSSYNMFKDHAAAKEAARVQAFDIAKLGISEIAARYKGPEVKAQAMNLIGQIELKRAETKFKLADMMRQRQLMAALQNGKGVNPELMPKEMRERYVPGYGLSYGTEAAKKLNMDIIPNHQSSMKILDSLTAISKMSAMGKKSPQALAEAGIDLKVLQGRIREIIVGPGTLSESDKADLVEVTGNPTNVFEWAKSTAKLNTLRKRLTDQFDSIMSQNVNGYVPRAKKFNEKPLEFGGN